MLKKRFYPLFEGILKNVAGILNKNGFTPNQLTLAGLVLNFLAGWLFASGALLLGAFMTLLAGAADCLDGPVARISGKVTKFGAFLDSTVDRYADFFLLGGLTIYFAREGYGDYMLITLGILAGSFVTSYAKARAENLIEDCSIGIFDRAVRVILLILGTAIIPLLPLCLWILLLGTNATAIQRIFYTRKVLEEENAE